MDLMVFHWLNGVLGESRVAVELAYFIEAWSAVLCGGVLAWQFLRRRADRTQFRSIIMLAALAAVLSLWSADLVASEFRRTRPFVALPDAHLLIPQIQDSSFPCAAAMWPAAVAVVLQRLPKKGLSWFSLALAMLVGVTRPILGDHWPSDMAASLVFGGLIGLLVVKLEKPLSPLSGGLLRAFERAQRYVFELIGLLG